MKVLSILLLLSFSNLLYGQHEPLRNMSANDFTALNISEGQSVLIFENVSPDFLSKIHGYTIEMPPPDWYSASVLIDVQMLFAPATVFMSFDPSFETLIEPVPLTNRYAVPKLDSKRTLYIQVHQYAGYPIHAVMHLNNVDLETSVDDALFSGVEIPGSGNTWIKKLQGDRDFIIYCPLMKKGYRPIRVAEGIIDRSSGFVIGENAAISYEGPDGKGYILSGTMIRGRFIGPVFFGKAIGVEVLEDAMVTHYEAIDYLQFDNFGQVVEYESEDLLTKMVSCAAQLGTQMLVDDPVIGSIIAEAIGSYIEDSDFSTTSVAQSILAEEIRILLKKEGYDGIASVIAISLFADCLLK